MARWSSFALVAILLAAALAVVRPYAAAGADACEVTAHLVNPCRPWLGATANGYPEVVGGQYDKVKQVEYHETRIGRDLDVVHTYRLVGENSLQPSDVYFATRPGTILDVDYALTNSFARAAGGDADVNAQIDQMANSIKALGATKILLSVHHEPENDLNDVSMCPGLTPKGTMGTAADYRAMWANVRARFDALGVDNVVWVMNYMNYPPFNCMVDDLWPGDDLVDWITWNGYAHSAADVDFVARVRPLYDQLGATSRPGHDYTSKAWGIAEWSVNNTPQASAYTYYAQAQAALENGTFPRLKLYSFYDAGDWSSGDWSYRVGYGTDGVSDPVEQAAYDAFANSPAISGAWSFPDTTAPSAPGALSVTLVNGVPSLTWSPADDDRGVSSYDVLRDGTVVGTVAGTAFLDSQAPQGRSSSYVVMARDAADNVGPGTDPVSIAVPDTAPPSAPSGLRVALVGGQPSLTWSAASDNVGVTSYDVLRGGVVIATSTSTSYTDRAAPQGVRSTYTVRAQDAARNVGAASSAVSLTVPDTTAPSAPTAFTVVRAGTRATLRWGAASDNVAVSGYWVYRGTTRVATLAGSARAYTATGLRSGTRYTFAVRARDAAGNLGPAASATG